LPESNKEQTMRSTSLVVVLFLAAGGCATSSGEGVSAIAEGKAATPLTDFTVDEIRTAAGTLLVTVETPDDEQKALMKKLDTALKEDEFNVAIRGVVAYSVSEGGLLFKFGSGKAVASFKGGGTNVPFKLSATAVGLVAGGSRVWGIGLIQYLDDEAYFGSEYDGTMTRVVEPTTYAANTILEKVTTTKAEKHRVICFGAGSGASVDAGAVKITFVRQ
jgi:hypothetical protein